MQQYLSHSLPQNKKREKVHNNLFACIYLFKISALN